MDNLKKYRHDALVVLDIGTSAFKAGSVDLESETLIYTINQKFNLYQDADICESDFNICFNTSLNVLEDVINQTRGKSYDIKAILITSQAQTFAPVDKDFNVLSKGIVWLDQRAKEEEGSLAKKLSGFPVRSGLPKPSAQLYISKLLWLKNNQPEIFNKASFFPIINEYIVYGLTGKFYSDYTNFGMTGILDIREKKLNLQVLDILELSPDTFPDVKEAVSISYDLKLELKKKFKIKHEIPVYFCGNDQSASAAGAGIEKTGDIFANFGTAMVTYTYINNLPDTIEPNQIAGISPIGPKYFLLSCEEAGNIIDTIKNASFPEISYDEFFSKYYSIKDINLPDNLSVVNNSLSGLETFDADKKAGFTVKYFLDRFCFHLSQIERYVQTENIYISGGMTKSGVWVDLLKENIKQEITLNNTREAALIGAVKIYKNGSRNMPIVFTT